MELSSRGILAFWEGNFNYSINSFIKTEFVFLKQLVSGQTMNCSVFNGLCRTEQWKLKPEAPSRVEWNSSASLQGVHYNSLKFRLGSISFSVQVLDFEVVPLLWAQRAMLASVQVCLLRLRRWHSLKMPNMQKQARVQHRLFNHFVILGMNYYCCF